MITKEVIQLAKKVSNYLMMHHQLEKADCILVLGTYDERLAMRGAELYLTGWAPLLVFSGGLGEFAKKNWHEPEAERFTKIAIKMGVPKEKILIEKKSTNTGENIIFTKELFKNHSLDPHSFIIVQKPHMERRSYATFKKHWPDKKILITSPQISFEDYPTKGISMKRVINTLVGDMQRIKIYPKMGYQIYQEIPDDVWSAYEKLVELGYDERLISE
ncbi:MAG: hypothetical protein A2406_00430 [Candidatus Komeilibacteria bacterium RIFOXYC1_FULL_37_11]|uniref:DUF218 domain-containing protein n=1 Tax=Candidatus Komeilibacteria bacterium RIFOXYC1_FULL_37_11 TaxID=1798555 RepID=A0A1G2BXA4_9BACT|nr:MAG: hypothetical protein A2406_00430 [Candidatus Komeilibacteria bacterium RIFOXYC1_FULL_37_11]OGY95962.1 MAG: hypothetical protein A2611_04040 [Candidatus Komeilibacteria bacterium RIFOXYD1_FULL_37_29]